MPRVTSFDTLKYLWRRSGETSNLALAALPAGATPDKQSDCTSCHGGGLYRAITTVAPSTTYPVASATYSVAIGTPQCPIGTVDQYSAGTSKNSATAGFSSSGLPHECGSAGE